MKFEEMNQYKIMTMKNLINSAKEIMVKDGIDAITIRKVGDLAGLNSATMYNYFENLDHLKLFACLFYFNKYIDDLKNYIKDGDSIKERYYAIWTCFIKHTVEETDVFYNIFFNSLSRKTEEYVKEFYKLFPQNTGNYGSAVDEMLNSYSITDRNISLLRELAKEGYIKEDRVDTINDLSSYAYEAILYRIYKGFIGKEEGAEKMRKLIFGLIEE